VGPTLRSGRRSVPCTFHNTLSRFAEVRRNRDDRREKLGLEGGGRQGKSNERAREPCPSDLSYERLFSRPEAQI